jgi:histone H3/H4
MGKRKQANPKQYKDVSHLKRKKKKATKSNKKTKTLSRLVISKLAIYRICRDISLDLGTTTIDLRMQGSAVYLLHRGAEQYITHIFKMSQIVANHANYEEVTVADMQFVIRMIGSRPASELFCNGTNSENLAISKENHNKCWRFRTFRQKEIQDAVEDSEYVAFSSFDAECFDKTDQLHGRISCVDSHEQEKNDCVSFANIMKKGNDIKYKYTV